jgi:hypothetical protein
MLQQIHLLPFTNKETPMDRRGGGFHAGVSTSAIISAHQRPMTTYKGEA